MADTQTAGRVCGTSRIPFVRLLQTPFHVCGYGGIFAGSADIILFDVGSDTNQSKAGRMKPNCVHLSQDSNQYTSHFSKRCQLHVAYVHRSFLSHRQSTTPEQ
jgi:hypothetical protein